MGWISVSPDARFRCRYHVFQVRSGSGSVFSGSSHRGIDLARKKLCPRWRNRRSCRWATFVRRPATAHSSGGEPRKKKLAEQTPVLFLAFDLLKKGKTELAALPLSKRRLQLEQFA